MAKIINYSKGIIPGLTYLPNFINQSEKHLILNVINQYPWCDELKRYQQYYGIKYFQTTN